MLMPIVVAITVVGRREDMAVRIGGLQDLRDGFGMRYVCGMAGGYTA